LKVTETVLICIFLPLVGGHYSRYLSCAPMFLSSVLGLSIVVIWKSIRKKKFLIRQEMYNFFTNFGRKLQAVQNNAEKLYGNFLPSLPIEHGIASLWPETSFCNPICWNSSSLSTYHPCLLRRRGISNFASLLFLFLTRHRHDNLLIVKRNAFSQNQFFDASWSWEPHFGTKFQSIPRNFRWSISHPIR